MDKYDGKVDMIGHRISTCPGAPRELLGRFVVVLRHPGRDGFSVDPPSMTYWKFTRKLEEIEVEINR